MVLTNEPIEVLIEEDTTPEQLMLICSHILNEFGIKLENVNDEERDNIWRFSSMEVL